MPSASVVIPTYNRKASLARALETLGRQNCPPDFFDVIVVDDGSTDGTSQLCAEAFPFRLYRLYQQNQGSAAARNAGAQFSRNEIVLFIDDDILVEPAYVLALTQAQRTRERAITAGALRPFVRASDTLFKRVYVNGAAKLAAPDGEIAFSELTSNNVCLSRADFTALGMWRDVAGDRQTLWGDVEFGYRAFRAGFTLLRVGAAVCYHDDYAARDLGATCRRAETAAERAYALFGRYPELMRYLPMFADKTPVDWGHDSPRLATRKLLRRAGASAVAIGLLWALIRAMELAHRGPVLLPLYRWLIGAYIFRGYRTGLAAGDREPIALREIVTGEIHTRS